MVKKKETYKRSRFITSCSVIHIIREYGFFLTAIANLEPESQARFFIPVHVATSISSFPPQAQLPPYLRTLESSKYSDVSAILELPMNLNNPNSLELQSSSCNMLPAYGLGFFVGLKTGANGTEHFSLKYFRLSNVAV